MAKLKHLAIMLAGCLLIGGSVVEVAAQSWDGDRGRNRDGARERDRGDREMRGQYRDDDDDDDDRGSRRGGRGNDDDDRDRRRSREGRGWESERGWRGGYDRGRNCYVVTRRIIQPDGDVILRRSRVCE